jgi:hypothetical protein
MRLLPILQYYLQTGIANTVGVLFPDPHIEHLHLILELPSISKANVLQVLASGTLQRPDAV